jgi:hypothetical protein
MQNTAAEEESLKGVTVSDDCFAKLQFVISVSPENALFPCNTRCKIAHCIIGMYHFICECY